MQVHANKLSLTQNDGLIYYEALHGGSGDKETKHADKKTSMYSARSYQAPH